MPISETYRPILAAIEQGAFEQAAQLVTEARETAPNDPRLDLLAGEVSLLSEDYAQAVEYYRAATRAMPTEATVWGGLCEAAWAMGDYVEAFEAGQQGLENGELTPRQINCLGIAMAMLGEREGGAALLEAHTQAYPAEADPWQGLGAMALLSGDSARAESLFTHALKLDPDLYEAHTGLGQIAMSRGEFTQASEHFISALRLKPNYLPAREGLIESLWQLRAYQECLDVADQLRETEPYNRTANFRRGLALFGLGRDQEGEEQLSWQMAEDPTFVDAAVWLGGYLESVGRADEALLRYQQGLDKCPDYREETKTLLEKRIEQLHGG